MSKSLQGTLLWFLVIVLLINCLACVLYRDGGRPGHGHSAPLSGLIRMCHGWWHSSAVTVSSRCYIIPPCFSRFTCSLLVRLGVVCRIDFFPVRTKPTLQIKRHFLICSCILNSHISDWNSHTIYFALLTLNSNFFWLSPSGYIGMKKIDLSSLFRLCSQIVNLISSDFFPLLK